MSAFKSPFEKLSYEAQDAMAKSVNPGGALYSLLERLVSVTEASVGGLSDGGRISKEALAAVEGLGLASKRMASAIAIIAAAKPKDVEKFFGVFTELKKTLIDDLTEETKVEMLKSSAVLGTISDAILNFGTALATFAAMSPVILFGAAAVATSLAIINVAMGINFVSNVFGVFLEDQIGVFAENIAKLAASLVAFAALSPVILIGALSFWLTMTILRGGLNQLGAADGAVVDNWFRRVVMGKKGAIRFAIETTKMVGFGVLVFGITMAVATPFIMLGTVGAWFFYKAIKWLVKALLGDGINIKDGGHRGLADKRQFAKFKRAVVVSGMILVTMILLTPALIAMAGVGILSAFIALGAVAIRFAIPILVNALAGAGKVAGQAIQGVGILAATGVAIVILAYGLGMMAETFKMVSSPWEFLGWSIAITSGFGLAMTGLGVLVAASAGTAFLGPLMIAAIGGSLIALAAGIKAWKGVKWSDEDTLSLTTALAGIKAAFMGGGDSSDQGFFASIKGALGGAMDAAQMMAAAVGYTAAGIALSTLSRGLIRFQEVGWTTEKTAVLTEALAGIAGAFAAIGGQEQVAQGGFLGSVFGLKTNKTAEGIRSVMDAGDALTSIAVGLKAFEKLYQTINFGEADSEGKYAKGTMGYAIVNTMAFVSAAFAQVADQGNVKAGGILGIFGVENNKVEEGIRAVQDSGDALKGIVEGLTAFQALVKKQINWEELGETIAFTIGFVSKAFATVVDQGSVQQGGFFGSLLGIQQNKVAEGIESVSGVGVELKGIADGLVTFQELIKQKISWEELGNAISKSIGFVSEAFAAVADQGKTTQSGFWGTLFQIQTSKVSEGVESVMGAQEALNGIADSLNKFQGLENPKELASKISDVLGMVNNAFANIENKERDYEDLRDTMEAAAEMYEDIADASNDMNIEAIATTARMFEALGYLSEQGGQSAIEELGETLIEAIQELAGMIANFEGTVGTAATSNATLGSTIGGLVDKLNPLNVLGNAASQLGATQTTPSSGGGGGGTASLNVNQEELIAEIKRLQSILVSGDAVVQVETGLI